MIPKKKITTEEARMKMASLCAKAEQCEFDITSKLTRYSLQPHEIREIIEFLTANRFIDNARFAKSFANDKCRFSAWGRYKILQTLAAKRIAPGIAKAAVDAISPEDYGDVIMRAAKAKAKSLPSGSISSREDQMKLYRHLLSRGFESPLAVKTVKALTTHDR